MSQVAIYQPSRRRIRRTGHYKRRLLLESLENRYLLANDLLSKS